MATTPSILAINILPEEEARFREFRARHPEIGLEQVAFHRSVAHGLGGLSQVIPVSRPEVDLVVLGHNYDRRSRDRTAHTTVPAALSNQLSAVSAWFPSADILVVTNVPVWTRENHGDQLAAYSAVIGPISYSELGRLLSMVAMHSTHNQ